jgi:hypothetical protein
MVFMVFAFLSGCASEPSESDGFCPQGDCASVEDESPTTSGVPPLFAGAWQDGTLAAEESDASIATDSQPSSSSADTNEDISLPPLTCEAQCGATNTGECSCASSCLESEDCCPDACEFCGVCPEPDSEENPAEEGGEEGNGDPQSCVNACGGIAPGGCSCDAECVETGTCCPDACDLCGACPLPGESGGDGEEGEEGGNPESCDGFCESQSPSGCYCDSQCMTYGDCCPDACALCGICEPSGETGGEEEGGGTDPESCLGFCENIAPSGCYCDTSCVLYGDCCPDACALCGACDSGGEAGGGEETGGGCVPDCAGKTCGDDGCGGSCGVCPPEPNSDPGKIIVFTANVENLPEISASPASCAGDWMDLLYYWSIQTHAPDFILLQQITSNDQLDFLAVQFEAFVGGDYGSIISTQNPGYWEPADCDFKKHQTNGILYRKDRFSYIQGSKLTWFSAIQKNTGCETATAPRYENLGCEFIDNLAGGKRVALASIHWPVIDGCGVTNATLTHQNLKTYTSSALYIWGGDVNLPDLSSQSSSADYKSWYKKANMELAQSDNLGYRDAIYSTCLTNTGGGAALKDCLIANGTLGAGVQPRYDYLFSKYANDYKAGDAINPTPLSEVHTIGFDEAGAAQAPDESPLPYSKHRAVRATIHW